MASYTDVDLANADRFSDYNYKVRLLTRLVEKQPHLATWITIQDRAATSDDFYIPPTLAHACRVLTLGISKELCEKLSCNPIKEKAVCRPTDIASYYRVGDDGYDVQCQPACFNTSWKDTYDEHHDRAPDTPMLNWNQGECRIVNSSMVSFLEKPYYRSETHYEPRVNDMPTGFSRVPNDAPNSVGFTYATNETYCKYYDRHLQPDGSCTMNTWELALDAIVGMSLVNTVRSAIRMQSNGNVPFDLPDNLPPLPEKMMPIYTLNGWKKHVNRQFKIPKLLDTMPRAPSARTRRAADSANDDDDDKSKTSSDGNDKSKKTKAPTDAKTWRDTLMNALHSILDTIGTDSTFWQQFGIGVGTELALNRIRKLSVRVVERLSAFLARGAMRPLGVVGSKVMASGLQSVGLKIVATTALRIGGKGALMLAKFLGAATSVVGWILVATMILDFIFSFWDPYGYNNLFPPEYPKRVMENAELAYRQMLHSPTANYELENLVALVLTEDEQMELRIESLFDRIVYLDSLVVNSEGTMIDKGEPVDMSAINETDTRASETLAMAKRVRFDPESFARYNKRFHMRTEVNRYLNYMAIGTVIVAVLTTAVLRLTILGFVFFVLAIVVFCLARLSLEKDVLVDVLDKVRSVSRYS